MEKWDLYTKDRVKTGRSHTRGEELPEGLFHLVVHIWLKNPALPGQANLPPYVGDHRRLGAPL